MDIYKVVFYALEREEASINHSKFKTTLNIIIIIKASLLSPQKNFNIFSFISSVLICVKEKIGEMRYLVSEKKLNIKLN